MKYFIFVLGILFLASCKEFQCYCIYDDPDFPGQHEEYLTPYKIKSTNHLIESECRTLLKTEIMIWNGWTHQQATDFMNTHNFSCQGIQ